MKSGTVLVSGERFAPEDAKVSVYDRGYLYGDGVFETFRAYAGRPFRMKEHLGRLERSARTLLLDVPGGKAGTARLVRRALKVSGLTGARARAAVRKECRGGESLADQ